MYLFVKPLRSSSKLVLITLALWSLGVLFLHKLKSKWEMVRATHNCGIFRCSCLLFSPLNMVRESNRLQNLRILSSRDLLRLSYACCVPSFWKLFTTQILRLPRSYGLETHLFLWQIKPLLKQSVICFSELEYVDGYNLPLHLGCF